MATSVGSDSLYRDEDVTKMGHGGRGAEPSGSSSPSAAPAVTTPSSSVFVSAPADALTLEQKIEYINEKLVWSSGGHSFGVLDTFHNLKSDEQAIEKLYQLIKRTETLLSRMVNPSKANNIDVSKAIFHILDSTVEYEEETEKRYFVLHNDDWKMDIFQQWRDFLLPLIKGGEAYQGGMAIYDDPDPRILGPANGRKAFERLPDGVKEAMHLPLDKLIKNKAIKKRIRERSTDANFNLAAFITEIKRVREALKLKLQEQIADLNTKLGNAAISSENKRKFLGQQRDVQVAQSELEAIENEVLVLWYLFHNANDEDSAEKLFEFLKANSTIGLSPKDEFDLRHYCHDIFGSAKVTRQEFIHYYLSHKILLPKTSMMSSIVGLIDPSLLPGTPALSPALPEPETTPPPRPGSAPAAVRPSEALHSPIPARPASTSGIPVRPETVHSEADEDDSVGVRHLTRPRSVPLPERQEVRSPVASEGDGGEDVVSSVTVPSEERRESVTTRVLSPEPRRVPVVTRRTEPQESGVLERVGKAFSRAGQWIARPFRRNPRPTIAQNLSTLASLNVDRAELEARMSVLRSIRSSEGIPVGTAESRAGETATRSIPRSTSARLNVTRPVSSTPDHRSPLGAGVFPRPSSPTAEPHTPPVVAPEPRLASDSSSHSPVARPSSVGTARRPEAAGARRADPRPVPRVRWVGNPARWNEHTYLGYQLRNLDEQTRYSFFTALEKPAEPVRS